MSASAIDRAVESFAAEVGTEGPVTVTGLGSRGGPVPDVRTVVAPSGIDWIQPAEMTIGCGAGTPVEEVEAALAEHGQCLAIPDGGTIGGMLAVGRSGIRRLGWGPVRDTVLQARYVSAKGEVVKAGGPTVKNVSGFDVCRLLVGSQGTLGFLADVILRTRPLPVGERWFTSDRDPWELLGCLYRPTSLLWDGGTTWVLLDGHGDDLVQQAELGDLVAVDGPPPLPPRRWSLPPSELGGLTTHRPGPFVAEIGVGVVHHTQAADEVAVDPTVRALHGRIKHEFDPTGRMNPGVDVLAIV
ncbi:MAG TPA: FAD-binding protein [Ilumatobacteraceae bacterium]|nr:FAD-binding protein [Ilumatobacteraceae bacterium]